MMPGHINDADNSYITKAFLIRYCEEECELSETILFRAEVDVEPDYLLQDFYLECTLYFTDMANFGGVEKWQEVFH